MKRKFIAGKILLIILMGAATITALGFVIMFLWNNILTRALHVNPLSFWHALGLFALCKILFGFSRGHGGPFSWKRRMKNRLSKMSPDEREKFKEEMCRRASFWHRREGSEPFNKKTENVNKNPSDESNDY